MQPKIRPAQSHKSSVAANSPPLRIRTRRPKRPKRLAAAVHAEPLKRAPRQPHKRRLKAHVNAAKTDKRSAVAAPRDHAAAVAAAVVANNLRTSRRHNKTKHKISNKTNSKLRNKASNRPNRKSSSHRPLNAKSHDLQIASDNAAMTVASALTAVKTGATNRIVMRTQSGRTHKQLKSSHKGNNSKANRRHKSTQTERPQPSRVSVNSSQWHRKTVGKHMTRHAIKSAPTVMNSGPSLLHTTLKALRLNHHRPASSPPAVTHSPASLLNHCSSRLRNSR